jgi:hypothetical protein
MRFGSVVHAGHRALLRRVRIMLLCVSSQSIDAITWGQEDVRRWAVAVARLSEAEARRLALTGAELLSYCTRVDELRQHLLGAGLPARAAAHVETALATVKLDAHPKQTLLQLFPVR